MWEVLELEHMKFKKFIHQLRFTLVPWILYVHHMYGLKLSEQDVGVLGLFLLLEGICCAPEVVTVFLASSLCPPSGLQIQTTNHKWGLQEFTSKHRSGFQLKTKW